MGYSEKSRLFLEGLYSLPNQPLATAGWRLQDWIQYVDWFGHWMVPVSGSVNSARVAHQLPHGIRLRLRVVC